MIKKKINYFQLIEILDGFGGVFLGMVSLLLKQQWEPIVCFEKANDFALGNQENVDGFDTINTDFSWEYDKEKSIILHYNSRSGKYYKFFLDLKKGSEFPHGGACHYVEFPEESALVDFIQEVCASKGTHPNPLFRRRATTTTDTEVE